MKFFPDNLIFLFLILLGILDENKDDLESEEQVFEAIGDMLQEVAGNSKSEIEIKDICFQLLKALKMLVIIRFQIFKKTIF